MPSGRLDDSAAGKLIFHVFASLTEFERNLIRERPKAGLDATRARGRLGGRKPKLDDKQKREILALPKDPNVSISDVAKLYQVSRTAIYKQVGSVVPTRTETDNPDLPLQFIKDTLLAVEEANAGQLSDYQFGDQP